MPLHKRVLWTLALALFSGCPAEPSKSTPRGAAPTPGTTEPRPATPPEASGPAPPNAPSPPPLAEPRERRGSGKTQSELLALDPAQAFVRGVKGPSPSGLALGLEGEVMTALVEQLEREGTPPEALDQLWIVFLRACDGQAAAPELRPEVRRRLGRDVDLQTKRFPVLRPWARALLEQVDGPEELQAAGRFLERTREVWGIARALKAARRRRK